VVIESGTIGAIGVVLGLLLGLITAWIWIGINYRYLLGFYLQYHYALWSAAWFGILVMLMTVLAGYGAARHAMRQSMLGVQTVGACGERRPSGGVRHEARPSPFTGGTDPRRESVCACYGIRRPDGLFSDPMGLLLGGSTMIIRLQRLDDACGCGHPHRDPR
jgi:hypothetical protein